MTKVKYAINVQRSIKVRNYKFNNTLYFSILEQILQKITSSLLNMLEHENEQLMLIYQLKEKVQSLEAILDSINDGFFTLDTNLNFTYINKAFERICNCRKEDFIGTNYWEQFPKAMSLKFNIEYSRALLEQQDVHFEEYASSLDRWVSVSVYPSPQGLSVYFTDITEKRNAQKLIEQQNEQLKEIAWIQSHKVRGPLASILGLAKLLEFDTNKNVENKEAVKGIIEAGKELDTIIKEIDKHTKLMSGDAK